MSDEVYCIVVNQGSCLTHVGVILKFYTRSGHCLLSGGFFLEERKERKSQNLGNQVQNLHRLGSWSQLGRVCVADDIVLYNVEYKPRGMKIGRFRQLLRKGCPSIESQ